MTYFLYFYIHPATRARDYFGSAGRAMMAAQHALELFPDVETIDIMKVRTSRIGQQTIVALLNGTGGFSGDEELVRVARRVR